MDRWTKLKVTPSNQTLILANDGPAGTPAQSALRTAMQSAQVMQAASDSDSVAGDSVLKRVTIVTAHPDSTMVYVQADYAATGRSFAAISPDRIVATIPAAPQLTYGPRWQASSMATTAAAAPSTTTAVAIATTNGAVALGSPVLATSIRSSSAGFSNRSTRPVDLYASTQNILRDSASAFQIDVHA